jgi:hypothetical protein
MLKYSYQLLQCLEKTACFLSAELQDIPHTKYKKCSKLRILCLEIGLGTPEEFRS